MSNKEIKIDIANALPSNKEKLNKEKSIKVNGKRLLFEPDEEFKSCCFECDKELVLYFGKMIISGSVLGFSFIMLQNPANDVAFYTSTISLLLGHFLNSGGLGKKEKSKERTE
mgnify:CR=1 FL=1